MLLTEEEAKTKRCPETMGPPQPASTICHAPMTTHGMNMMGGAGLGYAVTTCAPQLNCIGSACIGSACMAWRWQPWDQLGDVPPNEVGYCGKAGKP